MFGASSHGFFMFLVDFPAEFFPGPSGEASAGFGC